MTALARIEPAHDQPVASAEAMPTDFDRLINGSVNQLIFSDARMDRMIKMAEILAKGKVTVPAHLQNNIGDCMAIVLQAAQWNMDPFAVAQKTHLISGKLGYEAQLVNAVVITRAPITGRPQYEWFGDWERVIGKFKEKVSQKGESYRVPGWGLEDEQGLGVKVWMTMRGESEPRVLELLLAQATVRNSTLWAGDPKQQLAYLAIKRWARLYCPDVLLGVYSADEMEETEPVTAPAPDSAATATARLKSRMAPAAAPLPAPPPGVDAETGEALPAEAGRDADPIADLLMLIGEAQTTAELEAHRDAVAALKNGDKRRAVVAWTAKKEALRAAGAHAYPAPVAAPPAPVHAPVPGVAQFDADAADSAIAAFSDVTEMRAWLAAERQRHGWRPGDAPYEALKAACAERAQAIKAAAKRPPLNPAPGKAATADSLAAAGFGAGDGTPFDDALGGIADPVEEIAE